jgi:hypothetical protein
MNPPLTNMPPRHLDLWLARSAPPDHREHARRITQVGLAVVGQHRVLEAQYAQELNDGLGGEYPPAIDRSPSPEVGHKRLRGPAQETEEALIVVAAREEIGDDHGAAGKAQRVVQSQEGIAQVQQNASEDAYIHRADLRGYGVDCPVHDSGLRLLDPMVQPVAVVHLADNALAFLDKFPVVGLRKRNDVPWVVVGEVIGDHLGSLALHMQAEKAAGTADIKRPLPGEGNMAKIAVHRAAQVPLALNSAVSWDVHGMIKPALGQIGDDPGFRIDSGSGHLALGPRAIRVNGAEDKRLQAALQQILSGVDLCPHEVCCHGLQ